MEHRPSLAGRAFAAIALMIGFYALALGLAGLLLYLPYAEMQHLGRVHGKLAIFAVVGAGLILWSIVPRLDRFEAPGPRLVPEENPDLFEEIGRIARATHQEPPREERRLFAFLADQPGFPRLTETSWDAVAEQVWVKGWRENRQQFGRHLGEATVAELPCLLRDPAPLLPALAQNDVMPQPEEKALARARVALGTGFALALVERGYAPSFGPGDPARLVREGHALEPFVLAEQLQQGELDAASFAAAYRASGLDGSERLGGAA
jgi:hypothetical protein